MFLRVRDKCKIFIVRQNAKHLWHNYHGLFVNFYVVVIVKSCLQFRSLHELLRLYKSMLSIYSYKTCLPRVYLRQITLLTYPLRPQWDIRLQQRSSTGSYL